jgi:hypothetical protein
MRRVLLGLALGLWASAASAQCIAVGGVNNVPIPGLNCLSEPIVATYAATGVGIVAPATPTDVACLTGGAGVVVRVQKVIVSATITTQVIVPALLTKHASADTGGTPGTGTQLPVPYRMDSSAVAAVATTTSYTANPTIADAAPGIVSSALLVMSKADGTNGAVGPFTIFDFTESNYSQKPILRGVAQQLCVNLNGTAATMTGNLINVTFIWSEASS